MLRRHTMDGLIIGAHALHIENYQHIDLPVIAFDRYLCDEIPIIRADHHQGGQLAANALLRRYPHHVVHRPSTRRPTSTRTSSPAVSKQLACSSTASSSRPTPCNPRTLPQPPARSSSATQTSMPSPAQTSAPSARYARPAAAAAAALMTSPSSPTTAPP